MRAGSTRKTALIYLLVISLLFGTAALIGFQASATIVKVDVEIRPERVDLGAEDPGVFKFYLTFSGKYKSYKVDDIDPTTVWIDGILQPKPKPWKIKRDNTLRFHVVGQLMIDLVILPKIYHMGRIDPNPDRGSQFPYKIDITVTGQLYDGTQFTGTDSIKAYTPQGYEFPVPLPPPG